MSTDLKALKNFDEREIATTLGEATDLLEGLAIHGASPEQRAALAGRVTAIATAAAAARATAALKGSDASTD